LSEKQLIKEWINEDANKKSKQIFIREVCSILHAVWLLPSTARSWPRQQQKKNFCIHFVIHFTIILFNRLNIEFQKASQRKNLIKLDNQLSSSRAGLEWITLQFLFEITQPKLLILRVTFSPASIAAQIFG